MHFQVGDRVANWILLEARLDTSQRSCFLCRCVCGREKQVDAYVLKCGRSKSCGCQRRNRLTHGYTPKGRPRAEYQAWNHMIQRCNNPRDRFYKDYGARGISVCSRWQESFTAFLSDVGDRPSDTHSLDRIDNERGYEPGNVRWATRKQQARNKRRRNLLTFHGVTRCVSEWSELTGIKKTTIAARKLRGLPVHRILTPVA